MNGMHAGHCQAGLAASPSSPAGHTQFLPSTRFPCADTHMYLMLIASGTSAYTAAVHRLQLRCSRCAKETAGCQGDAHIAQAPQQLSSLLFGVFIRYCGVHNPACVVKCLSSGKWFCNGRMGSSGSCIIVHLVRSDARADCVHMAWAVRQQHNVFPVMRLGCASCCCSTQAGCKY